MYESLLITLRKSLSGKLKQRDIEIVIQELSGILCETDRSQRSLANDVLLTSFLSSKRLEGCSEKTLSYYRRTLDSMCGKLKRNYTDISTEDLRQYLSDYQSERGSGKVTIDNMRRIFSSFYSWLEDEEYIIKSPVRRIHKVKFGRIVKDTFSDEELETMRDHCGNLRNLSIVEFLASTGVRVGELVRLNRDDINFNERECVVLGKGDSQRPVYFDARTKLHLQEYLESRTDQNPAVFVTLSEPHTRLSINGVESFLKNLEKTTKINNIHPHKFRRTMATMAIDKGMPIEQVQKLLGHVRIDTTMHYAMVNQENVRISHRKYVA